MGGIEDDEPPVKRLKATSVEVGSLLITPSPFKHIRPLGGSMARPVPSQGKDDIIGAKGVIKRGEFVKIITKALYTLGYVKSGAILEEESGIPLHSPVVNLFRQQVLDGNLDDSLLTLREIELDDNLLKPAMFLILEQKFFEFLENDNVMDALNTLRCEITPLGINKERVHELCSCIISPSQNVLLGLANLGVKASGSRMKLLEELQKLLPPTTMIPERRLEHLVEQSIGVQRQTCYFHNSHDAFSLYTDHQCAKDQIPSHTTQVLQEHLNEVWFCQFSNQGKYLASASCDGITILWEVCEDGQLIIKHKLSGHERPIVMAAWSPDDNQLLTCGLEEVVRLWDVDSGKCLHTYEKSGSGLVSCSWFPDGKKICSTVTDKSTCVWDLDGKEIESWKGCRTSRTGDVAVTKNGKLVISMCQDNAILLNDKEKRMEKLIEENQTITSFSISRDEKFLLVNLMNQEIHLWNIMDNPELIKTYSGHKRSRFLISSCFGGCEQAFIASGSEDSQVYIWHRSTADLVDTLTGHSGAVNCVSWNPSRPDMLASASDDHTIRIWGLTKGLTKVNLKHKETNINGYACQCNGNSK